MLMPARKFNDLRHFCFSDLECEHAANTHAMTMDMEHHLYRVLAAFGEEFLQDVHNEFHRRVVIIEQQNLVERRFLGFRARARDDTGAGIVALSVIAAARIAHAATFLNPEPKAQYGVRLSQKVFWLNKKGPGQVPRAPKNIYLTGIRRWSEPDRPKP